jgi:ABC-type Fe3+/spermidine/putrescine transport system ATPase subunit
VAWHPSSAVVVRLDGGERCLAPAGLAEGRAVELAIRPEAMRLVANDGSAATAGSQPELYGHVLQSAYLGTSVSHQVRTDGGLVLTVVAPRSAERPSPGDRVTLAWDPADTLVLERPADTPTQDHTQTQEEERR